METSWQGTASAIRPTRSVGVPFGVPYEEKQTRAQFLRKLAYYLSGIAIGFVLLGVFQNQRKAQIQRQAELQRQQEEAAKNAPSPFPPLPSATQGEPKSDAGSK